MDKKYKVMFNLIPYILRILTVYHLSQNRLLDWNSAMSIHK